MSRAHKAAENSLLTRLVWVLKQSPAHLCAHQIDRFNQVREARPVNVLPPEHLPRRDFDARQQHFVDAVAGHDAGPPAKDAGDLLLQC